MKGCEDPPPSIKHDLWGAINFGLGAKYVKYECFWQSASGTAEQVTSHYLGQYWLIVDWTLTKKISVKFESNYGFCTVDYWCVCCWESVIICTKLNEKDQIIVHWYICNSTFYLQWIHWLTLSVTWCNGTQTSDMVWWCLLEDNFTGTAEDVNLQKCVWKSQI